MKNLTPGLLLLFLLSSVFIACEQDPSVYDQTAPIITLIGDRNLEHPLGEPYVDPGALAYDNQDGDLTDSIIIVNTVNPNQMGDYTVTYNVMDKAGNPAVEVIRDVEVVFSATALAGDWTVTHNCSQTSGVAGNQTVNVNSSSEITFSPFISVFGALNFDLDAEVNGSQITIPSQDVNQFITVSGSGTINNDGTEITISVTIENSTPIIGGTDNCTLNYVKQ